ncbi:MAG: hypothetical protein JNM00_08015 [Flavobacteriales bacterium]|nr:hypothetical protein [Flavobacteriales bacterium]
MKKIHRYTALLIFALFLFANATNAQKTQPATKPAAKSSPAVQQAPPPKPAAPAPKPTPPAVKPAPPAPKPAPPVSAPKPAAPPKAPTPTVKSDRNETPSGPMSAPKPAVVTPYKEPVAKPAVPNGQSANLSDAKPVVAVDNPNTEVSNAMPECTFGGFFMSIIEQPFQLNPNCINRDLLYENQRNCGCSGQVTFYNETADTLWLYFDYKSNYMLPVAGSPSLESIEQYRMKPDLILFPYQETSLLLRCDKGMIYEAVPLGEKGRNHENRMRGVVRFSCMSTEVILDDQTIDESDYYRK